MYKKKENESDKGEEGSKSLRTARREKFCQMLAFGDERLRPRDVYSRVYSKPNNSVVYHLAYKLTMTPDIKARIAWLKAHKDDIPDGLKNISTINLTNSRFKQKKDTGLKDLVIGTCRDALLSAEKGSDKITAIRVLEKLGVFERDKEEDDKSRMSPSEVCEYLAQYASHSGKELLRMPRGLPELVGRIMALTGASVIEMKQALDEAEEFEEEKKKDEINKRQISAGSEFDGDARASDIQPGKSSADASEVVGVSETVSMANGCDEESGGVQGEGGGQHEQREREDEHNCSAVGVEHNGGVSGGDSVQHGGGDSAD